MAQALSRSFKDNRKIAVYGAGDTAERNMWSFAETVEKAEFAPEYYIDDTPEKHNTYFHGKRVINFEEAHRLCKGFRILICSDVVRTRDIITNSLRQNPIEGTEGFTTLDNYIFCRHANEVLLVYDMLEDDFSKVTYANMILTRMTYATQNQRFVTERTYYEVPEFMTIDASEVYVDCGAYTGDTVEQYLIEKRGQFHKIFAFEPSESNFSELTARVMRLKQEWRLSDVQIELLQAGIGEKSYRIQPFHSADTINIGYNLLGGCVADAEGIPVFSIDDYFSDQPISLLKADIEGYEWKMLCGAERVIQRDKPKMAICLYHSSSDMYRIALKVKAIYPDYKLSVRQHSHDILDTVLYAYL